MAQMWKYFSMLSWKKKTKRNASGQPWTNDCILPLGIHRRTYLNEMSLFQWKLLHLISHPKKKKMLSQTKLGKELRAWDLLRCEHTLSHWLHKFNTSPNACWVLFLKASSFLVSQEDKLILDLSDQWGLFEFSWRLYIPSQGRALPASDLSWILASKG